MTKRGFVIVVLKLGSRPKDISVTRDDDMSSVGRCMSVLVGCPLYQGVSRVDTGMTYKWVYGTPH